MDEQKTNQMKIITIEEHIYLKNLNLELSKYNNKDSENTKGAGKEGLPYYPDIELYHEDISKRINDMDKYGIDIQILSCPAQTQILNSSKANKIVQQANDELALIIESKKDRFGGFGLLPWSNIEDSVKEVIRIKEELNLQGIILSGRPSMDAIFLDDKKYYPILETIQKMDIPLYIHPAPPLKEIQDKYYQGLGQMLSSRLSLYGWGWHNEIGVQIIRMILSGVFEKFPKLKIIVGHWGEMVPFFLSRLDQALPKEVTHLSKTISETFKSNIYITPSGIFDYNQLQFCINVLGTDRIIHSVDFPFISNQQAKDFILNAPISNEDKNKIAYQNATKLLYKNKENKND